MSVNRAPQARAALVSLHASGDTYSVVDYQKIDIRLMLGQRRSMSTRQDIRRCSQYREPATVSSSQSLSCSTTCSIPLSTIALDAIGWKYYFVFVGVLICYEIKVYFLYPEIRGYTLEPMAVVFDEYAADNWPVGALSKRAVVRSKWSEHI